MVVSRLFLPLLFSLLLAFTPSLLEAIEPRSKSLNFHQPVDLERFSQAFVLESKQIKIPGYPEAFNPSIIRWNGKLLLSFRINSDPTQTHYSKIGLQWLDEDFTPLNKPQILTFANSSRRPPRAEDARLLRVNKQLYIIYNDCQLMINSESCRVYIAELLQSGQTFTLHQPKGLFFFDGADSLKREKNWTPFEYQDQLLLAYSLSPHRILLPERMSHSCSIVSESESDLHWQWGELRGGTQGLAINKTHYLSFFHSCCPFISTQSRGVIKSHYFIGAYLYQREPPFAITAISPAPIIGKSFYSGADYKPYWEPLQCVFPSGFVFDENFIWLVFGKQDHECWVCKIDKEVLLQSLIPTKLRTDCAQNP